MNVRCAPHSYQLGHLNCGDGEKQIRILLSDRPAIEANKTTGHYSLCMYQDHPKVLITEHGKSDFKKRLNFPLHSRSQSKTPQLDLHSLGCVVSFELSELSSCAVATSPNLKRNVLA